MRTRSVGGIFLAGVLAACAAAPHVASPPSRVDFTYDTDVPTLQTAAGDTLHRMGFVLSESDVEPDGGIVRGARGAYSSVIVQIAPNDWGSVARVQVEGPAAGRLAREIQKEIARTLRTEYLPGA